MKVLPLVGYKSLKALNAFHTMMLGLKMLPAYVAEPYDEFYAAFSGKTEVEKEKFIREAAAFVPLTDEEVGALVSFCTDKNGVPFSSINIGNLSAQELFECVVAVCREIGKIKVELVSAEEKKSSQPSLST